ncbi:hypothetical protein R6Q59_023224 [Mikania micrantha]
MRAVTIGLSPVHRISWLSPSSWLLALSSLGKERAVAGDQEPNKPPSWPPSLAGMLVRKDQNGLLVAAEDDCALWLS